MQAPAPPGGPKGGAKPPTAKAPPGASTDVHASPSAPAAPARKWAPNPALKPDPERLSSIRTQRAPDLMSTPAPAATPGTWGPKGGARKPTFTPNLAAAAALRKKKEDQAITFGLVPGAANASPIVIDERSAAPAAGGAGTAIKTEKGGLAPPSEAKKKPNVKGQRVSFGGASSARPGESAGGGGGGGGVFAAGPPPTTGGRTQFDLQTQAIKGDKHKLEEVQNLDPKNVHHPVKLPFMDKDHNDIPVQAILTDPKLNQDQLFFFQLPSALPITPTSESMQVDMPAPAADAAAAAATPAGVSVVPAVPATAAAGAAAASTAPAQPQTDMQFENTLKRINTGHVGKLLVYKSGKMKMQIGDVLFDVTPGTQASFLQEAAVIRPEDKQIVFLGDITQRLICTPDIDYCLQNSAT